MAILALSVFVPLALSAAVQGVPQARECTHVLKETFRPSKEWVQQAPAPPDHSFMLRIDMAQPNFPILEEKLYAVSNPESPMYGQHLSKAQVEELVAPHPDGARAVDEWLASHGFGLDGIVRSSALDWMRVKTTVGKAEEMLNTTYHVWENVKTGETLVRTNSWSVPAHLAEHIDLIHPTTMFRGVRPQRSTVMVSSKAPGKAAVISIPSSSPTGVDPSCNTTITPTCLLQLYNASDYVVQAAHKGNQIAITSYLEQFANIADLQSFYAALRPEALNSTFKLISINGGENNQTLSEAGDEADLDTQYAFSLTFPTPATVFTTGGRPPFIADEHTPTNTNEPYLNWVDFVLNQDNVPQTISTSYGDDEQTVPESFARTVCNKFAQLGARGVTLTFSSGDFGVGDGESDPAKSECVTNDGTNRTAFIPVFPATCPFVTSVGGTVQVPEIAVTRFGSGGGFSNYFSRPSYQDDTVEPFVKALGNTYKGLFNPAGRGFPDVAAHGDDFEIIFQGKPALIGGTSAASPTFAAIVSLLNDARIAAGKPSLGFLNPLIYSKASKTFNDITVGNNPGCGTPGFNATKGWDPVTGFGTPNFGLLKEIVLKEY